MVKQRFLIHFKPWLFTVMKVVGPIVGVSTLREAPAAPSVRCPSACRSLLMGALLALLLTALLCWLWAWGEWFWFKLRRFRGFLSELRQCFRSYWGSRSSEDLTTRKSE